MADAMTLLKKEIAAFAKARDWERFHTPKNLSTAMLVEAAELAEIFQWLTPEQSCRLPKAERRHLEEEIGDVMIYLTKIAEHYGIDVVQAARKKLKISAKKYPVRKAKGSMKKYHAL